MAITLSQIMEVLDSSQKEIDNNINKAYDILIESEWARLKCLRYLKENSQGATMKLSQVIQRNTEGFIIDGNYYEKTEIGFTEAELEINLEVVNVDGRPHFAQGTIDGHHFVARVN